MKYLVMILSLFLAYLPNIASAKEVTAEVLTPDYGNPSNVTASVNDCTENYSDLIKKIITFDAVDSDRGTSNLLMRLKVACNEDEVKLIVNELKTRKTDKAQDLVYDAYKSSGEDQEYQVRLLSVMGAYKSAVKKMLKALESIHPKVVSYAGRSLMEQLEELDEDEVFLIYSKADEEVKVFIIGILIRKLDNKYLKVYMDACNNGSTKVREATVGLFIPHLKRLNISLNHCNFKAATTNQKLAILNYIDSVSWEPHFTPSVQLGMKEDDQRIKSLARKILERVDPISALGL